MHHYHRRTSRKVGIQKAEKELPRNLVQIERVRRNQQMLRVCLVCVVCQEAIGVRVLCLVSGHR